MVKWISYLRKCGGVNIMKIVDKLYELIWIEE